MTFYDTHAHLDFPEFANDITEVVARAEGAGIERILTIGTDLASNRRALALAERFPSVYAVVGCHPNHVAEAPEDLREDLRAMGRHPKVAAIGEAGLDYYRLPDDLTPEAKERLKDTQRRIFRQQLEVAAELGLNIIIHQREAFAETLSELKAWQGTVRGVFHCFVGTPGEMEQVLNLGSLVSFTGIVTFKNAATARETLRRAPDGKFMLETDCPFLAPVPHRGRRCEPAFVRELAQSAAQDRGCSLEHLSRVTCDTARDFFPVLR